MHSTDDFSDISTNPPKKLWPFLRFFIAKQWKCFGLLVFGQLAWSIDQTIFPYVIKLFLDVISNFSGDKAMIWEPLFPVLAFGALLWLGLEVMFRMSDYVAATFYPKFEAHARMQMLHYVQHQSYQYFSDHFAGNLANKIDALPRSTAALLSLCVSMFFPSFVALLIGIGMFAQLHPVFALILAIYFTLHIGIGLLFAKTCNQASDAHAASVNSLSGQIVDNFTNILAIKSFARIPYEWKRALTLQLDEFKKHRHVHMLTMIVRLFQGISAFIMMWLILTWMVITHWQDDIITTGDVVYIYYTSWNLMVIAWLSGIELPNLFREIGVCRQSLRLLQTAHEIEDAPDAKELVIKKGTITFSDVHFTYPTGYKLFDGLNVTIEAGTKVGLVGFSGGGKTTFVQLMTRFFDVDKGTILVDGHDIRHVTLDSLRSSIASIPQDPTLFHRTLRENILYGRLDATDEELIEVSKKAHCHDFVMELKDAYETEVGERGVKLSGGQRQRIAIARAMLKNAPILILDEATSALDSVTEKIIQDSLHYAMEGRTTIVVAHRLSTLAHMERILVFSKGKIIEDGTHDALIAKNGHYAHLWKMQAGGFLPDKED